MGGRIDRWLAPRLDARADDTARAIAADPLVVAHWRGAVQIGTLTVRVAPAAAPAQTRRGDGSERSATAVDLLAAAGTDLRAEDRLQAEGGVVYRVTSVIPGQRWRVAAAAEVETR